MQIKSSPEAQVLFEQNTKPEGTILILEIQFEPKA